MIEPKVFYRKLDSLLATISSRRSAKDYLFEILKKFEVTFGQDLHICKGKIYENKGSFFELIFSSVENVGLTEIYTDLSPVHALLKSGIYIFDDPSFTIDKSLVGSNEYAIPAALLVSSTESSWIFVFELSGGWVREEVEFSFNAIRRALDYKLFSEAMQSELQQTAKIQQSLLPSEEPQFDGYDIAVFSKQAELVGGDLYDFFNFDKNEFGFCIGDASGHGLPAALMVRDVVTGLRMGVEKHMKMVHTLKRLNEVVFRGTYSSSFISLFFGELEINGNLFYMNAGHPSPYLFKKRSVVPLPSTGMVIGAFPKMELSRSFVFMEKGDVLVAFTDGIVERTNPEGEFFGDKRLIDTVKVLKNKPSKEILKDLFDFAYEFGAGIKWEDDASILVIKRN